MRHFEFVEGGSQKFWEISLNGSVVSVRYGRLGTEGKTLDKRFASAAAAQKEHDALIKQKVGKGYAELRPAESGPAQSRPAPQAPVAEKPAPRMREAMKRKTKWRGRFEAMVAELQANKKVKNVVATFGDDATDEQLAVAAKRLGRPVDRELETFYRELNGFSLSWEARDGEGRGLITLLPVEEVFGSWKDSIWFEGSPEFDALHPFDFFIAEACAAFDVSEQPLRVHYHYCGEERSPTNLSFEEYLERLLASRGFFYWVHAVTEAEEDSSEAETFLDEAPGLFKGFDKKLFVARGVDFKALSVDQLLARVGANIDEDEVKRGLYDAWVAHGAKGRQAVSKLLTSSREADRVRALRLLTAGRAKALDHHLDEVLDARSNVEIVSADGRQLRGALAVLGGELGKAGALKALQAVASQKEPSFERLLVLFDSLVDKDFVKPTMPLVKQTLARARAAFDSNQNAVAAGELLSALGEGQASWERALTQVPTEPAALAAWLTRVMALDLSGDAWTQRRDLALKSLKHKGPVALAAAHLVLDRPWDDADQLVNFKRLKAHPDPAVVALNRARMEAALAEEHRLKRPKSKFALALTKLLG